MSPNPTAAKNSVPDVPLTPIRQASVGDGHGKPVSVPGSTPTVPLKVYFYDNGSYDPDDGDIVKWEWNFADEQSNQGGWYDYTSTQGDAWHTYTIAGVYTAHLRVTDETGRKGIEHIRITLSDSFNANPIAIANADITFGDSPLEVNFSAVGSYDPDGTISTYEWDLDDGNGFQDFTSTAGVTSHEYTTGDLYTAILRITDDDGAIATDSKIIEVIHVPQWYISTVDSEGLVGRYTSMVLDSSYNPHISYYDQSNKTVKYAYYDGVLWHLETVYSGFGYGTSIALDSSDNPHIAFQVGSDKLRYAYYDGTVWHVETIDAGNVGAECSIALDSFDNPHISYQHHIEEVNKDLKYAYHDGTIWHIEIVDDIEGGGCTSIAIDSSNNPHISYRDATNQNLKYAYNDGVSWFTETVDNLERTGSWTSIALDSFDNPCISYLSRLTMDLTYAYFDGSSWHTETVDALGSVGSYTSLALDSFDNPHISYWHRSENQLKYAYHNGVFWNSELVEDTRDTGQFTSIALDSLDNPRISYYHMASQDLRFAHKE